MSRKIKEIAQILTGYQARKGVEACLGGTHFLLQIRDFNEARTELDRESMMRFLPTGAYADAVLQVGDVIFLGKGAKNFAFAITELPSPTLAAAYFFILRPHSLVLASYLAWYLNQGSARRHFSRFASTGAHMPVIRRDVLEGLEILLPELQAQKTIVKMDQLAKKQQALLAELGEKKQQLVTTACLHAASEFPSTKLQS